MLNSFTLRVRIIIVVILIVAASVFFWWFYLREEPLEGIVSGNGRLEAEDVNISTKYSGRVEKILVDEGDRVDTGETVAIMDTDVLEAQLKEAKAMELKALKQKKNAVAVLDQRKSECELAERNLERSTQLFKKGVISQESMDQAVSNAETSIARCDAAEAEVENADAGIEAARAQIERLGVQIEESILESPVTGRVQYRLAEPLEVLPAGGRVLTVIDLSDVYMTIFLSTEASGRISIGADSRVLLDAFPDKPLHAKVTFVASEAQFTPKEVETRTERQKLSFRVKVNLLDAGNREFVKPGMPGEAFILMNEAADWPLFLK